MATIHARVETSFDGGLYMKVAEPEPRRFYDGVLYRLPATIQFFSEMFWMLMIDG